MIQRIVTALLLLSVAYPCGGSESIEILRPGQYHGKEVPADAAGKWYELKVEGGTTKLKQCRVSMKMVRDDLLDEEGQATGVEISVLDNDQADLLIRGLPGLKDRIVNTATINEVVGNSKRISMGRSTLLYKARVLGETGFEIEISDGKMSQILYSTESSNEGSQSLTWAGDLDNDGKVDLLIHASNHYNLSKTYLFLSTMREKDGFVGEAATLSTTGC